ncbi:MAG: nucleotidyltransferase domain-containing protein [Candidatus Methanoperedens sp.]|nr:nucleotidyltransferase domain-containing protein [Candidatus Methanoperedens sp.]
MGQETDSVIERIKEYSRLVSKEFRLKKVILYGSRSRGDYFSHSDIDLILISNDFPKDWFKRQSRLHYLKLRQIEPIGYTMAEFKKMLKEGNRFIETVMKEGKEISFE